MWTNINLLLKANWNRPNRPPFTLLTFSILLEYFPLDDGVKRLRGHVSCHLNVDTGVTETILQTCRPAVWEMRVATNIIRIIWKKSSLYLYIKEPNNTNSFDQEYLKGADLVTWLLHILLFTDKEITTSLKLLIVWEMLAEKQWGFTYF